MTLTKQLMKFLVTGSINTVFGYLVYVFGVLVLGWAYFWAVVLSYTVGTTFSYFMFRTFVFTEGESGWRSYFRFIQTYVALFFVNVVSMYWLVDILGRNKLVAQAGVVVFCAALSFLINRIFVFRRRAKK